MYVHPLNSNRTPFPSLVHSNNIQSNKTNAYGTAVSYIPYYIHSSSVTSDQGHFEGGINLFSQGPALPVELKQLVWIRIIEFRILTGFSKLAVPPRKFKVSPGKVWKSV